MCSGISREKAGLKFMYILMATDMIKSIFKDSSLKNVTNTTKKRYWSIVRSDRFVRFHKNCYNVSEFPKRRKIFFLRDKLNSLQSGRQIVFLVAINIR